MDHLYEFAAGLGKLVPDQYRDQGAILPGYPGELFGAVAADEDIARHWRVCLGYSNGLQGVLEDLTDLPWEKVGVPSQLESSVGAS